MISSLPKLRSDLDLRQQATATGTALVIKDPASGQSFRFQEAEQFIAQQLDGNTPVEVVRQRAEEKLGVSLAPEMLAGFIQNLGRNGLLESDETGEPRGSAQHWWLGQKASTTSNQPELRADSVWGKYFRVRAAEYFLVRQLHADAPVDNGNHGEKEVAAEAPTGFIQGSKGNGARESQENKAPRKPGRQRQRSGKASSNSTDPKLQTVRGPQTVERTTSVVNDPASGDSVRPAAAEDSPAGQLGGTTSVPIVQQRVEQDSTTTPPPEASAGSIQSLEGNGRLENEETREPGESSQGIPARQEASTTSVLPKLRKDLTVSKQGTGAEAIFVIKDRVTGQFFRLREAEWFIARQCDGTTAADVIRQRTEEEFGAALPLEGLTAFVKKLEKAKLLESERTARRLRERQGRIRGSMLYLRVKLLDPDRLLDRLISKLRFCFTPYFVVLAASLTLLAAGIVATHWAEIGQGFGGLLSLSAIPVFLAVIFVVISAHEFAHGLTCKHFGGEVREMGFLLIYFQPALYCNVSDAWLFPEKSKRMWVGFAGPFFELFLWSLATLAWRVTEVGTWINYVALTVMISSGIKTLFNFNPLIKMDGYYLLSDYLAIPNLRKKSFRYIGDRIKSVFGLGYQAAPDLPSRERRIYLAYGLVATLGSLSLLSVAAAKIGGFLVEQGQSLALLFFTALLGTKLRRRYRRFFGRSSGPSDLWDDDEDDFDDTTLPEPAEPRKAEPGEPRSVKPMESKRTEPDGSSKTGRDEAGKREFVKLESEPRKKEMAASGKTEDREAGKTEPAAPRKKRKRRALKRRIALAALAGAILVVLFLGRMDLRIVGGFNILPEENADVRAAVDGIIEEIYVDEGVEVQAGDLIARLSDRDVRAELQKIGSAMEAAEAKLRLLVAGPRPEEIEQGRIDVARNAEAIKFATSRLERDKSLFENNLVSKQELEVSEASLAELTSGSATAKSRLDVLLAGPRPEEIEAMKASLASLESQRRYLEEQLRLMRVVSPASGIVATPSRQLKEMRRQMVSKGALIAKVYELKTVTAEIIVPEKEIADIKVGQEVALKARSYPDQTFHGRVTSIATAAQGGAAMPAAPTPSGSVSASGKTILVTTEIDNPALLLKAQMTGQAKIYCGERRIFDLVTRRLARTVKVEFWSWW